MISKYSTLSSRELITMTSTTMSIEMKMEKRTNSTLSRSLVSMMELTMASTIQKIEVEVVIKDSRIISKIKEMNMGQMFKEERIDKI